MRWLAPRPIQDIVREANATGRVLVVDETAAPPASPRASSPPWSTKDSPARLPASPTRTASSPSARPLEVLLSEDTIEAAAIKLTQVWR
jgi:2-oxoisovalerate dehydrogenase E1 component